VLTIEADCFERIDGIERLVLVVMNASTELPVERLYTGVAFGLTLYVNSTGARYGESSAGLFFSNKLMGCHVMLRSRCGCTSSTTHLAVTQHQGQMGSIQNSISIGRAYASAVRNGETAFSWCL
jgi:hypothetical protein